MDDTGSTMPTKVEGGRTAAPGRTAVGSGVSHGAGPTGGPRAGEPGEEGSNTAAARLQSRGGLNAALTADEALARDELARLRLFVPFVLLLVALVAGSLWIIGGDPTARRIMLGGLGLAALGATWASVGLARHPEHLTRYHFGFGMVCVVVITCGFYYFGVLSPALIIVTFGAFIFAVGQSLGGSVVITVVLILAHLTLSILTISGVIADRGLFRPSGMTTAGQLVVLALVHFIFVATFVMARTLRASQQRILEDLSHAARAVAQRELLLAEARQDLYQALQVGGPGRYTDQTLGDYRLGVLLGRGGMGEVYEAIHAGDGMACAVKLLHPHLVTDPAHFERFQREARMCQSLSTPNVVRVLEISRAGETPPYLVMERLEGRDLASWLKETNRLAPEVVIDLLRQVASGLAAAREAGVVHRDLKPQNLFCVEGPGHQRTWKILDFGASTLRDHHGTLTAGAVIGTPQYMAPEQARGQVVDHRADLYSLAVIAYRALTGYPAFPGGDVPAVLFAVTHKMPARPSETAPLPPQVDDVLAVGLAKDPAHRFDDADQLCDQLETALAGRADPDVRARAWILAAEWPWGETHGERTRAG